LPPILTMDEVLDEETMPPLAEALKQLHQLTGDKINIDVYLKNFQERTTFLKTKRRAIQNNQLFNIILNDLKYYKEKELDRQERK